MQTSGCNPACIWAIYGLLFLFGYLYNLLVAWLIRNGYEEGYNALLVVLGVSVTLAVYAGWNPQAALEVFAAFAASGFWMVVGSWWRHVRARRLAQELLRQEQ